MNNVITFYKQKPGTISVNGEPIGEAEIEAAMAQLEVAPCSWTGIRFS